MVPRPTLKPGSNFGDYEIERLLGTGAMAEVYAATNRRTGDDVALKVLPRGFSDAEARLRRFQREADAMNSTRHPNVVSIYDVGCESGTPFIAMERIDGPTLRELLAEGALPMEQALDLAAQIAAGLEAAHACGIVHRDLKPENIMVSELGAVKILDFGLSKPLAAGGSDTNASDRETHEELTLPGTILGTLEYMSPEQASGYRVDFRTDQFTFGSILYEMLMGTVAFGRDTMARVLAAIIEGRPAPMDDSIPESLRAVVERCLNKDVRDRFDSMEHLRGALEHARPSRSSSGPLLAAGGFVMAALAAAVFI